MENYVIIKDIELAVQAIGYTTNNSAVALSIIEQNQADWAEGFSTICIDEALRQTGDYADFCRGGMGEQLDGFIEAMAKVEWLNEALVSSE